MQYAVALFFGAIVALSATEDVPITLQTCDTNAVCVGYYEGFNCTCNSGYKGADIGGCVNIDECVETPEVCTETETCNDIIGSYNCTCGDINIECHEAAVCVRADNATSCVCIQGYTGDGVACEDINECLMRTDNCSDYAHCSNAVGSYDCTCYTGFEGDGFECTDIDECVTDTHNCVAPLSCNNTIGAFQCVCGDDGICDTNAYCNDLDNTTSCACNDGYTGTGVVCTDMDECSIPSHTCHKDAKCHNTQGSYRCICNSGFSGNGYECSGASPLSVSLSVVIMLALSVLISNNEM